MSADQPGGSRSRLEPGLCHCLRVRIAGPVDPAVVAARFAVIGAAPVSAVSASAASASAAGTLWVEPVPARPAQPLAARRREAELTRPVPRSQGLRAVLLRYQDGQSDLILAGHRRVVDQPSLRLIAGALTDGNAGLEWRAGQAPEAEATAAAAPRWGLGAAAGAAAGGTGGIIELGDGAGSEPAAWLAALAVVLSRYQAGEQEHAIAAVLPAAGRPPGALGAFDTTVTFGPDLAGTSLGGLVARFRSPAAQAPAPAAAGLVAAGLVFEAGAAAGRRRVPALARAAIPAVHRDRA